MDEILSFDGASVDDLDFLLDPPLRLCVDRTLPRAPAMPPRAGLSLHLTTAAAARLNVSGAFVGALAARQPWIKMRFHDVEQAIQEALANAVMHGNLGLESKLRGDLAGMAEFGRLMAERLANPAHSTLAITVSARWTAQRLIVTVWNEGGGYSPPPRRASAPALSPAHYGQGMSIIRSVSNAIRFADHGRCIAMGFKPVPAIPPSDRHRAVRVGGS